MKILIIGGTRFIGPHIISQLIDRGHDVTLFNRGQTKSSLPDNINIIKGDRNNLPDFTSDIKKARPDIIVDMMLLNETQARQLVEVTTGIATRLIIISSCDVYYQYDILRGASTDPVINERITEKSKLREKYYPYRDMTSGPDHIYYDYDKILAERVVMSAENISGTVLRFPMVYGPRDYQYRFYDYIKRMNDKRPAIILENGQDQNRITRGYVADVAGSVVNAVENNNAIGKIYNVGETDAISESEWIGKIAAIMEWKGKIISVPKDDLPENMKEDARYDQNLDIDTSPIRTELGYAERCDRREALRQTIAWQLANPQQDNRLRFDYTAEDKIIKKYQ